MNNNVTISISIPESVFLQLFKGSSIAEKLVEAVQVKELPIVNNVQSVDIKKEVPAKSTPLDELEPEKQVRFNDISKGDETIFTNRTIVRDCVKQLFEGREPVVIEDEIDSNCTWLNDSIRPSNKVKKSLPCIQKTDIDIVEDFKKELNEIKFKEYIPTGDTTISMDEEGTDEYETVKEDELDDIVPSYEKQFVKLHTVKKLVDKIENKSN